jgi:hypothetical protein
LAQTCFHFCGDTVEKVMRTCGLVWILWDLLLNLDLF